MFSLVLVAFAHLSLHAIDINLPANQRSPIRNQISTCQNFYVSATQLDDSVGIPFTAPNAEAFRTELSNTIAIHGIERLKGGAFYVLGHSMQNQKRLQARYQQILDELGLTALGARVSVLTVPSHLVEGETVSLYQQVMQRLRYFLPSLRRDYQRPQAGEVASGYATTAILEVPTVLFLYQSLPILDANVTVLAHAITLGAYTIYSKTMLNWLLRSGIRDQRLANIELFFKQVLLSAPFVVNYNVFGRFSEILSFYSTHGWASTLAAFPNEMASFATTQGLTLVLQTIFYSQVITKGFGKWVDQQVGEDNSRLARSLRPWLQTPILMLDAVFLAMASSQWGEPLVTLGPAELNWGHASLLAMTATASLMFSRFPKALDKTLPIYQRLRRVYQNYMTWLTTPSRGFTSPVFTDPNWGIKRQPPETID